MKPVLHSVTRSLAFLFLVISIGGCDEIELQSQWREAPITIDGIGTDWTQNTPYRNEKPRVLVSVMNDKENLFIRLMTRDRQTQMMFIRAGFITWIDEGGGTEKKFGVQFPIASQVQGFGGMPDQKARNSLQEILEDGQHSIAILHRPQGDRPANTISLTDAAIMGVFAKIDMDAGYLTYELQVPYSVSKEQPIIGIGFETGELKKPQGRKRSGGGRSGLSSGGGGRRGGGGGGRSSGKPAGTEIVQPFKMWARIHLADNSL